MKVNLFIQRDGENLIKDKLLRASENNPKKVQFYISTIKDTGFEIIEDCVIDLKARKQFVIGVDKKNTTKKMLQSLLGYTKNVYVFNNNNMVELNSNIAIFEYEDRAEVYIINGDVSEGDFKDNISTYTQIEYDLGVINDKREYEQYFSKINSMVKFEECRKLDKEYIEELMEDKAIFSNKQYTHNVMTISELLNSSNDEKIKKEVKKKTNEENKELELDEDTLTVEKKQLPKVDLDDTDMFDIEIDIEDGIKREQNTSANISENKETSNNVKVAKKTTKKKTLKKADNEEYVEQEVEFNPNDVLDLESLVLEKSDIELDKKSIKKKTDRASKKTSISEDATISKKIDLNKVTNLVLELPNKPSKGKDIGAIKVSNYIKDMIPNFFEALEKGKNVEKEDGAYKEAKITIELVNVKTGEKSSDKQAKIYSKVGQTYVAFDSSAIKDLDYEEMDIVRIIKLSSAVYHFEVVSKDVAEYKIWKKMCTQSFRGANRSYGLM